MIQIKLNCDISIKDLELIGKGTQGSVYRIDSQRCIKIFKKKEACREESKTLLMAQDDIHFTRLYKSGNNYIIREYIDGTSLDEYLSKHKLTPEISKKLIELYEAMVKVGYLRKDAAIFHIYVTSAGDLKLIDTAKAMRKKAAVPDLILSGLEDIGCKDDFFDYLKINRPDLYNKWITYTRKKYKKAW